MYSNAQLRQYMLAGAARGKEFIVHTVEFPCDAVAEVADLA